MHIPTKMYHIQVHATSETTKSLLQTYAQTHEWPPHPAIQKWHDYLFSRGKYYLNGAHVYFSDFEADQVMYNPQGTLTILGDTCQAEEVAYFQEYIRPLLL